MRKLMTGLVVAMMVGAFSASAEAGNIFIKVSSSTCSVACADQIFDLGSPTVGAIATTIGDVEFVVVVGASNNPGTAEKATLGQSDITVNATGTATETVTIEISQTGFTNPFGPNSSLGSALSVTGSIPTLSSVSLLSGYDPGNSLSTYTVVAPLLTCNVVGVVPPANCSDNSLVGLTASTPFSLSNTLVLTITGGSTINTTATTTLIAPDGGMTMSFLGLGLLGVAMVRRRILG